MAKVVIAAFGSYGDVVPLTDIGCRLREAGHEVTVTSMSGFGLGEAITGCGLRALPIDFEIRGFVQLLTPAGIRTIGGTLLATLRDEPVDVLMLAPFCELAGHALAEARNIPSIGVRMQPLSTTAAYPPSLLGAWSGGPMLNRAAGRFAAAAIDRVYGKPVAAFRDQLGLPAVPRGRFGAAGPRRNGLSCTDSRPRWFHGRRTGDRDWRWSATGGRSVRSDGSRPRRSCRSSNPGRRRSFWVSAA
jgi:UDP:flavonoid glycosyltransferase YjiC (YdhE family)